jgi:hypothetical protein
LVEGEQIVGQVPLVVIADETRSAFRFFRQRGLQP